MTLPANAPRDLELGVELGTYGAPSSTLSGRLASGLLPLLTSRTLNARHVAAMRRHYQVSACLTVQSLPIVRADWGIECDDDDIREWLTAAYGKIADDVHKAAPKAMHAGYSPLVLVWDVDAELGGLTVRKIRDLEPDTCQPLVDPSGSYAGFRQRDASGSYGPPLDPRATLWLVENMESGNLSGRPLLEAALEPWQDQLATRIFHSRYLERFGEPVVKVRTPNGETVLNTAEIRQAYADQAAGISGVTIPPEARGSYVEQGREIGESLRNHSVVSFPSNPMVGPDGKVLGYEWDLDFLEAAGGHGADFRDAMREQNTAIARAIFVPDLLFSNTDTGAYALGQEHRSIFDAQVEGRLDDYARQITRHLIDRLLRYNYGDRAPAARLVFGGVTDTDRSELWQLATTLVEGGRLPVDTLALASRLGVPVIDEAEADVEEGGADLAASPFASVGLPALIASGVITEQEGRDLLGIPGTAPGKPAAPAGAFSGPRPSVTLASAASVAGLPDWQIPQSYDPPPYRRALTSREKRVPFAKIEGALNTLEADTIARLLELLDGSREKVLRQVRGILGKATIAEQIAGLESLDLGLSPAREATVLDELIRASWQVGLDSVRDELGELSAAVPDGLGPEARATARTYAVTSASRHLEGLRSDVILKVANGLASGTTRSGIEAIVADTYAKQAESEGKPVRLTTRHHSSQALNLGRRDAIERSGIPLRGAQYSAILDRRTCTLCTGLDERVIDVTHPDLRRFTPPVHHSCRCVWVWITRDEVDFTPTWESPSSTDVGRFGSLVV